MAQAILQDRGAVRVAGIVERQECELQDNGTWRVRDTETGSGEWLVTTANTCDCWDFRRRCVVCKHIGAVRHEERMLEVYAASWNARAEQQRQTVSANLREQNPSANLREGPQCPTCGGRLECQSYYVGGRGMLAFLVCTRDAQHRALPA